MNEKEIRILERITGSKENVNLQNAEVTKMLDTKNEQK